jgi:hypothetical protein
VRLGAAVACCAIACAAPKPPAPPQLAGVSLRFDHFGQAGDRMQRMAETKPTVIRRTDSAPGGDMFWESLLPPGRSVLFSVPRAALSRGRRAAAER